MHQFLPVADQLSSLPSVLLHRLGQGTATLALVATSLAGLAVAAPQATAADNVQITYGSLEAPPISVSDLESFARTGIPSRDLQLLLNILRIEEDQARQALTQNVLVDVDNLRDASNTFAGQFFWRLLATTMTFSDNDSPGWELLRNAVLDTATSGELTILDVLRTIEASTLQVDGRRVMAIASQIDFDNIEALASIFLGQ
ncbi:alpha/beta hydrolase [Nodosilinea sp. AN01ver1]|uniref:alpha/beta hydrolase n=1 Tax=Nodosilinea sp. AN01ver1 TaxID=3423362 RepID=UPI003D31CB44